jgi:hypothetical protein
MRITKIETLRTDEFANVLWVRIHTEAGVVGLGKTFYGAGRSSHTSMTRSPGTCLAAIPCTLRSSTARCSTSGWRSPERALQETAQLHWIRYRAGYGAPVPRPCARSQDFRDTSPDRGRQLVGVSGPTAPCVSTRIISGSGIGDLWCKKGRGTGPRPGSGGNGRFMRIKQHPLGR